MSDASELCRVERVHFRLLPMTMLSALVLAFARQPAHGNLRIASKKRPPTSSVATLAVLRAIVVQTPTANPIVAALPGVAVTRHYRRLGNAYHRCEARWLLFYELRWLVYEVRWLVYELRRLPDRA